MTSKLPYKPYPYPYQEQMIQRVKEELQRGPIIVPVPAKR